MRHAAVFVVTVMISTLAIRAQVITQVKYLPNEWLINSAIDGTGSAVYCVATTNQLGTNPGYIGQIFRFDPVTGAGTQLTGFAAGVRMVSVTDDGQWLAFISEGDLTGGNHDQSAELFVMHPDGTGLAQLTSDTSFAGMGVMSAIISGSGNRVLFTADTDSLGLNPLRREKLFVVNRDGTGLVQLGEPVQNHVQAEHPMGISDDGERIVFSESAGMFTIEADGSNRQQRTVERVGTVFISGNGEKLVYWYGDMRVVNWDGTGASTIPGFTLAGITDDGATLIYRDIDGICKIGSDGTGGALVLANPGGSAYYWPLAVAGDGSRVAANDWDPNAPSEPELHVVNGSGGEQLQLTNFVVSGDAGWLTLLPNASRMFFASWADLTGANPQRTRQIYTILPNGTGLSQLTALPSFSLESYSVSDASIIAFDSGGTIYRMNPGGPAVQVAVGISPQIRFDGQWIVFQRGGNTLMKIKPDGTGLATIIDDAGGTYKHPRLNASSLTTWIAYQSDENTDGLNPSHQLQVLKITIDGTSRQRITNDQTYSSFDPDISLDGTKIVWSSNGDFAGENPAHLVQTFLYDTGTASIRQISHSACNTFDPRITRNGAWVYYLSCSGLVRTAVSNGVTERVQGFGNVIGPNLFQQHSYPYIGVGSYCPDTTGAKTALAGYDLIGRSPNSTSLFLADQTLKPKFTVGKASPTLLSWDPDPQSIRFDVLRGNVANLSRDASNVQLGAVACLENDSPDADTVGNEDLVDPLPGQAFFYLYRGTVGEPPVTGSYGVGTGNRERVATSGGCNP